MQTPAVSRAVTDCRRGVQFDCLLLVARLCVRCLDASNAAASPSSWRWCPSWPSRRLGSCSCAQRSDTRHASREAYVSTVNEGGVSSRLVREKKDTDELSMKKTQTKGSKSSRVHSNTQNGASHHFLLQPQTAHADALRQLITQCRVRRCVAGGGGVART